MSLVLGDSKYIVDWALDIHVIHSVTPFDWLGRVRRLMGLFPHLTLQHIYWEFNTQADDLSKQAIGIGVGSITWEEFSDGVLIDYGLLTLQ